MVLSVVLAAFVLVLPVELPDKTLFATLVLATRFPALPVFVGVGTAFGIASWQLEAGRQPHRRQARPAYVQQAWRAAQGRQHRRRLQGLEPAFDRRRTPLVRRSRAPAP